MQLRVQMQNTPSSAVKEPRIGLHFVSLNLLVCIQIEIEIAFPVSCFYLARLAIRERTEKMISLLRIFSSEREIRSHGSMTFCRTWFTRKSYYGNKKRCSVAEISDNIDCIIRLDLCKKGKDKWKSRWTWRRKFSLILKIIWLSLRGSRSIWRLISVSTYRRNT